MRRKQGLSGRLLAEACVSHTVWAVTLTYAPGEVGAETLVKRDVQLMLKRFRKDLAKRHIFLRYFFAGEYGEKRGRCHWHGLLFFDKRCDKPFIEVGALWEYWPHGWSRLDQLFEGDEISVLKAARYVSMYALKEYEGGVVPSVLYSKMPALGSEWIVRDAARRGAAGEVWDGYLRFADILFPDGKFETFPIIGETLINQCVSAWVENFTGNFAAIPDDSFLMPYLYGRKGDMTWLKDGKPLLPAVGRGGDGQL